jgi:hypothetical protein
VHFLAGTYSASGQFTVNDGTVTFDGLPGGLMLSPLVVNNGTAVFTVDVSIATIHLIGGTLRGAGELTVTNDMVWSGGRLAREADAPFGKTIIANGALLQITGSADKTLARRLENFGVTSWLGGNIPMDGGDFANQPGGDFRLLAQAKFRAIEGSSGNIFTNDGTVERLASGVGGFDHIFGGVAFNNNSDVSIQFGTIQISTGTSAGTISVDPGAALEKIGPAAQYDLAAGNAVTGSGTISVSAGTLIWGGTFAGTINVTTAPMSQVYILGAGLRQFDNLEISGFFALQGSGSLMLNPQNLTLGFSGILDLTNNAMIIDYPSGQSPIDSVQTWVSSGYAFGSWNGVGINSSFASGQPTDRAIGYAEATDLGLSKFMGYPIDNTSVLLRYTITGDADLDAAVGVNDLGLLASNWQQSPRRWSHGNFDYNSVVNVNDLGILASHWQLVLAAPNAPAATRRPRSRIFDELGSM